MSNVQKQDLVIFSDHSVLSNELFISENHHMISITSSAATSPFWLINALVEDLTLGAPHSLNSSTAPSIPHKQPRPVIIMSFMHDAKSFTNALSKLKISPSSYVILDLLTDFVVKNLGKKNHEILADILKSIPVDSSSVILLEQPEILISLCAGLTSDILHREFINPLMRRCGLLVLSTTLYSTSEDTRDGVELSRFITSSFYKSIAVLSLRPLETGLAKDVTGWLRISRGGASNNSSACRVVENEYLYLSQKENTRLFYK